MKPAAWLMSVLSLWSGLATASPGQDHAAILAAAQEYAHRQTQALPGETRIRMGTIDPRLALEACAAPLRAYLPAGTRLQGNTRIAVRCEAPREWTVLVPVKVSMTVELLVTNKPLARGSIVKAEDFTRQRGEMDRPGVLTSPRQAVGQIVKYALGAGQILRADMLHAPNVIRHGQTVAVSLPGQGYLVSNEGLALNDAGVGADVRVRLPSGKVMTARATAGGNAELVR